MTRELTPLEVLQVAAEMERKAAGMYDDPRISKLFSDLSQWEKRHMQVFAAMKDRISEQRQGRGSLDLEPAPSSQPQVPLAVFSEYSDPSRELTGAETKADVFRLAIQKEKQTIAYYTSLTEFALGEDNLQVIKDILQEERRHVKILAQSLEQTTGL
jgi:rubrerythrin